MGIRLYPATNNHANLETIAGVPAGTYARMEAVQARHNVKGATDHAEYNRRSEAQWNELNDDPDMGRLDGFLVFGWGKFNGVGIATDCCGCIPPERMGDIRRVLDVNGINADPALCEGLCWS